MARIRPQVLILIQMLACVFALLRVVDLAKAETPGERFRKQMGKMAKICEAQKLLPTDSRCILPKLQPADPLDTEEGRFAHSIKIPNPVPADSGYKPGMTPEQYFEHLCKTEAGEFIFKAVEDVEGLYLMRPRDVVKEILYQHLFAMEDPAGYSLESPAPQDYFVQPPIGKYEFVELPGKGALNYRRYHQDPNANPGKLFSAWINGRHERISYVVALEEANTLRSQYGYTWRGIHRPNDRELGITGGELIVMDLETSEILAVRRRFVRGDTESSRLGMVWGKPCPLMDTDGVFILKVLKPAAPKAMNHGH